MMYRVYSEGIIEVITGPMFAGKSEELIKRVKILGYANIPVLIVKPAIDNRWSKEKIFSRAGNSIKTASIKHLSEITKRFDKVNYKALAIDEVQFFDAEIIDLIINFANKGIRVIISGLDQDFEGKPFGIMPKLLAIADLVDKQHAVCNVCGRAATMTFRKNINRHDQILVGDKEYEPRCRECHYKGMLARNNQKL